MSENQSSMSGADVISGTRKSVGLFLVKTKGYKEQFDNKQKAMRAFDKIKSTKISNEESFTIELFSKDSPTDAWQLINESKIDKSFYQ